MNIFGVLYRYELKKLFQKRNVWVSLTLCVAMAVLCSFSELWGNVQIDGKIVDTNYHYTMTDLAYQQALDGRALDQELLAQMVEA